MKIRSLIFQILLAAFIIIPVASQAQANEQKLVYTYTFEGLKSAEDAKKLDEAITKLGGVITSKTEFKSAEHNFAKLYVEVRKPRSESEKVCRPEDLKALLLSKNFTPGDFKMTFEPLTK